MKLLTLRDCRKFASWGNRNNNSAFSHHSFQLISSIDRSILVSLHTNKTELAEKKHNRRNFIKLAGAGIILGTAFLWEKLVRSQKQLSQIQSITIPFNLNQEFTFHRDVIVANKNNNIVVYSSKCTHLGCTIGHAENGELVCPCHGSKFDIEGNPLNGPAVRPLQKLAYQLDKNKQQITIEL